MYLTLWIDTVNCLARNTYVMSSCLPWLDGPTRKEKNMKGAFFSPSAFSFCRMMVDYLWVERTNVLKCASACWRLSGRVVGYGRLRVGRRRSQSCPLLSLAIDRSRRLSGVCVRASSSAVYTTRQRSPPWVLCINFPGQYKRGSCGCSACPRPKPSRNEDAPVVIIIIAARTHDRTPSFHGHRHGGHDEPTRGATRQEQRHGAAGERRGAGGAAVRNN